MLAESFEFPEINSILRWQDFFTSFNKIALIAVAATMLSLLLIGMGLVVRHHWRKEAPAG